MTEFVHLHLHSAYSLSEGAIPIAMLADLCRRHRMPAVAVTDTNNLFGALEASEVLSAAGVQPVTGIQMAVDMPALAAVDPPQARAPHIVLLAQNEAGYKNLMKLSSAAFLRSAHEGEVCADLAWLEDHADGLICLSGGAGGPLDRLLQAGRGEEASDLFRRLKTLFPGRLYVELQRRLSRAPVDVEDRLIDLAYAADAPLVATNEPFFPSPDDYEAHDALLCIAEGTYVYQDERRKLTPDHYFKSGAEMAALFADLPEATANTIEVARRCAFRPRTRAPILPQFLAGDGDDARDLEAQELETQAREGLKARLRAVELAAEEAAYWDRLKVELDIINRMGFPGYFLIVSDFIKWAKAQRIPVGPGRGSGAGSVVAWALTITDLDPLRFGLLFERFLNPERVSMPDFDIDFCQDRRDEVIRYVQEKYGADRVAQIITFGKLQARAVLRDVGRVLGMPFGQVDRLCKLVPNNPANPVSLAEAVETEPRLREERDRDAAVDALLQKALKLEGLYRHASTHAAGVVIGDRPLDELTPLYLDPRADMPATQFNMKWVEPAGLVKFDFLGLKTLTVIDRALGFIQAGADVPAGAPRSVEEIPFGDEATFKMLGEGASIGVFQLESAGMRATLRAMKPDSLEDIIALVSLYRPGPMENIPTYIDRKQGLEEPDYLHPSLQPVLQETYGVIIYQEQVMRIAQILSGYSLGEADLLRRAMGKKKKEEMDRQRLRFVKGATVADVEPEKASSIFDLVQKFAGYGFNKSHAAAYALIAYQTAFLKANFPAAFLAASMSLDRANTDKLATFLKEARRSGVPVRAPHINYSESDFSVRDGAIIYGLAAVKNVGEAAMEAIAEERRRGGPFRDLHDFAERVALRTVGKRSLENLARAGAFDGLCGSREQAFAAADLLLKYSGRVAEERGSDQGGLFDALPGGDSALERPPLPAVEEAPSLERLNEERRALGFYLSGHPLEDYASELERLGAVTFSDGEARARNAGFVGLVAAVVRSVRVRRSKSGKPFAWVECSDTSGEFEITVFSDILTASRDLFEEGAVLLFSAAFEERDGEVRLTAEAVRSLDAAAVREGAMVRISVAHVGALRAVERRLRGVRGAPGEEGGDVVLCLETVGGDREVDVNLGVKVPCTPAMRGALRSVDGVEDVELVS